MTGTGRERHASFTRANDNDIQKTDKISITSDITCQAAFLAKPA